jgi:hypothetical protein
MWPKKWLEELGIFLATPGVSWLWIQTNFNMTTQRLAGVKRATEHVHHLGQENAYTATEEDALMYQHNKPHNCRIPFWAEPFIMDDVKSGMSYDAVREKWKTGNRVIDEFVQGRRGNVLYTGRDERWRRNLAG